MWLQVSALPVWSRHVGALALAPLPPEGGVHCAHLLCDLTLTTLVQKTQLQREPVCSSGVAS